MTGIFLKLVSMSIAASLLILVIMALRLLLKRAPKSIICALWALVGIRLLCPFSWQSHLSLVPEKVASGSLVSDFADSFVERDISYYEVTVKDEASVPETAEDILVPVLTAIWLLGVFVLLLYAVVSCIRLRRRVSEGVRQSYRVWLCDRIDTPFILGILRPRIYLPSSLCQAQLAPVLAHENAHLKRRDHWWKPLGYALLALYWFNPLCWAAYILLCRDIELACDERVIRDMNTEEIRYYAEALLACSVSRRSIAACPLAFGEVEVKERVKKVLHYKRPAFWLILAAVAACIAAAVCFLTNPFGTGEEGGVPDEENLSLGSGEESKDPDEEDSSLGSGEEGEDPDEENPSLGSGEESGNPDGESFSLDSGAVKVSIEDIHKIVVTEGSSGAQRTFSSLDIADGYVLLARLYEELDFSGESMENDRSGYQYVISLYDVDGTLLQTVIPYEDGVVLDDRFYACGENLTARNMVDYAFNLFHQGIPEAASYKLLFGTLESLEYHEGTCDGLPEIMVESDDGTLYQINLTGGWVWRNKTEEAKLTEEQVAAIQTGLIMK